MKQLKLTFVGLAAILFGCQQVELSGPNEVAGPAMKTVSISADMSTDETKASLDSQTGEFSWQTGDIISVLATDGKFYDFALTAGEGERRAEFEGKIPETASITTVATYPKLVADGSENTVLSDNTLNFVLPNSWTYVAGSCNVPMVATFGEGAEDMYFKQVGGVMRFPVNNLPKEATFVVTMHDKEIVGTFPVDIENLGESAMVAGTQASTVTVSYSADVDGASAEFSIPVPTGVYNNFNVTIKDAEGNELFSKDYVKDNTVERRTLLMMKELVLPERPMTIEVWPYYVDARVLFDKKAGVDQYAFYIDGSEEPVIIDADDYNGKAYGLIGGKFAHNSTHTVAVAKVVDGEPVAESMSEKVSFTTGRVMQMTYNTGTKFICAAWDDVAIGVENSTVYDESTGKWTMVPLNDAVSARNLRGYRVQLYAEDKTTLLYDEIPFSSQVDYGGGISSSSWIGKIGGQNVLLPTSLTFGWLEPGKTYYFRVQTLAKPVVFNSVETGLFKPDASYTVSSSRGGCGWSDLVAMTTDTPHVPSANEVLFEGFDDMMFNSDIMNISVAAVPEILTTATKDSDYKSVKSAALYKAWAEKPFSERKFSEQGFNTMLGVFYHGLTDDATNAKNVPSYLNKYAGSLEGWSVVEGADKKPTRTMNPNFGSVRLGESGTASGKISLRTKPLDSDLLSDTKPTKCKIKVKVSAHATTSEFVNVVLGIYHYRDGVALNEKNTVQFNLDENGQILSEWAENYTWTDKSNYIHYPRWFEAEMEYDLLKGDVIGFEKANPKVDGISDYYDGCITLGEITIEAVPEVFEDDGVGTQPDDTDYDVFNLGEFPISYWYTIEPASYVKYDEATGQPYYDHDLTVARHQELKDAGFNIVNYYGHGIDRSITENKRIHDVCEELGLKFLANVWAPDNATRIQYIKEYFGNSDTYVGEHYVDEPDVLEFDAIAEFVNAYNEALPDKEVYINLFPQYANAATQLKTDYENYIDQYLKKVKTKTLSYDYYGLGVNSALANTFYSNLDFVRSRTIAKRMPYWVITQAGIVGSCRQPDELDQRWSVWATIAGGSKGIAYFCYWTPSNVGGSTWDEKPYMITQGGEKTEMYYWVQKINADINTIGKKLLPCHSDGMILTTYKYYPLYENAGAGRSNYGPVKRVSGSGAQIACGCFRDARISENGDNYKGYKVLVTHEFPQLRLTENFKAYLQLDPSVQTVTVTHNNTEKTVQLTNTLNEQISDRVSVAFDGATLVVSMPEGEAALIEF